MHKLVKDCLLKLAGITCLILLIGTLQGCATSRLTGVWSDPEYTGGPIKSAVIVGLTDNEARRRNFENDFSSELEQLGVKTIPSETIISAPKSISKEEATQIIRNSGKQAAIVTRTISIDTKTETSPARYVPGGQFYDSFPRQYGAYRYGSAAMYIPAQQVEYTVVRIETNVYDIASGKCIWSATSESIDPTNVDKLIASIIKTVTKDMQKKRLLPLKQ